MLENEIHSNERLVSMGRVVASIAHEIRNPLGIIRSSAELLQRRTDKADAGTRRILGAIYDEAVRLSQTVNDFLTTPGPVSPSRIWWMWVWCWTRCWPSWKGKWAGVA